MARKVTMKAALGKGDADKPKLSDRNFLMSGVEMRMREKDAEQAGEKVDAPTPPVEAKRRKMAWDGKRPANVPDGASIVNGTPASEPVKNETLIVSRPILPGDGSRVVAAASRERESTKRGADPFAPEAAPVSSVRASASPEVRPGYKLVKAREVLPHVSVYLHPKVIARFKDIAAVEGRKAHAVYLEALDQYLQNNHGVTLESLSRE